MRDSLSHNGEVVQVEVVFTVRNLQASKMNVTYVAGSINSPTNFQQHFQNFTTAAYKSLVDGSSDRSYTYTFRPDARLPPRAFYLALTVFYHEAGTRKSMQSDTFFNQTVELIDQDRIIDTESFSLYITLAIILAAAGVTPCSLAPPSFLLLPWMHIHVCARLIVNGEWMQQFWERTA